MLLLAQLLLPASLSNHPWLTPVSKEKDDKDRGVAAPPRAAPDTEMAVAQA